MMKLQFWRVWSTPSLSLLPDLFTSGVVAHIKVSAVDQIDLFKIYLYSIEPKKQLHKKITIITIYFHLLRIHLMSKMSIS